MRTIKRGGEFVWRNYMYNAFERKERDEKERERKDQDSQNGGE